MYIFYPICILSSVGLFTGIVTFFLFTAFSVDTQSISNEGGLFETISVISLSISIFLSLYLAVIFKKPFAYLISAWVTLFLCRELDLHKYPFGESFLKLNFYSSDTISLSSKIGGALFISAILFLLFTTLKAFYKNRQSLNLLRIKNANHNLIYSFGALSLIVIGKILDSSFRLFPFLEAHRGELQNPFRFVEEWAEMIGVCFVSVILLAMVKDNPRRITN